MATIITKFSSTPSSVPSNTDLVQGELAVNTADKRLYTEDNGNVIIELGTNPSSITTPSIILDGRDLATDRTKLDGIEPNATADQTDAEIKTAYENNADTNAFTDSEKTKLGTVESGADVTDATNVDAAGAVMNSDTSTAAMSFVIDDDSFATASNTTVPTSESVEARINTRLTAIGAVMVDPTPTVGQYARFKDAFTIEGVDLNTDPRKANTSVTLVPGQSTTLTLSEAITSGAPIVSATKEVPQVGVTNNNWDAAASSYELEDSAYSTTLDWVTSGYDMSQTFTDGGSVGISAYSQDGEGIYVKPDGTSIFVVDLGNDRCHRLDMSTPFDITTATKVSQSDAFSNPHGLDFKPDGTEAVWCNGGGRQVIRFTLSTAWDVTTMTAASTTNLNNTVSGEYNGISFNSDGTKFFAVTQNGASSQVEEYTCLTAYDTATLAYVDAFVIQAQTQAPQDVRFNADGTKMFILSQTNSVIYEYDLSTGFDVSTATYNSVSYTASETTGNGLTFSTQGVNFYILAEGTDTIEQRVAPQTLDLGTGSWASGDVGKTIEANDGVFILTATDGSYVETTAPTSYAQVASGSWSMYAIVYDSSNDRLELSGTVQGAFDVSTAAFVDSFSVSAQDTSPQDIAFNTDGTKMFIVGALGDDVNEYTLSTGFDVSTASFVDSFSVASQESIPTGIAFNNDGTKMFIVGASGDDVNEYTLGTGFDVSTASYSQNFSVASQGLSPQGIAFNTDGTKMFIVDNSDRDVSEYTLGTGFDVSTATYSQNFSVSAQDTSPTGIAFNNDGIKMFVVGDTGNDVNEYTLGTGFDISTASYSQNFSVASQDTNPTGIAFNNDGTKMFIVGSDGDDVNEYNIGTIAIPSGYNAAHTTLSINSTYWTDINSMTADETAGDGTVYYAVSTDDRTTWSVIDNTDGVRDIVRNNAGTWEYNSNATYGSETWTAASTNTELSALQEAMAEAENFMNKTQLEAVTDANHFTLGNDLDLAIIFNLSSGSTVPSSDGVSINYDANTLNEVAIQGTDYDADFPATDKVRITAITSGNYKVSVV